jgi:putative transposase
MARQLRLDSPGLTHHITSRGNEQKKIFRDDDDCLMFLELLAEAVRRFGWVLHTYVLMVNHYHLVLETPRATLSDGMQWLNGRYAQWFNKRYRRSGHLFQGRFHSFLIDSEEYLNQVVRYVALNPVRVRMVARPEDYRWSGYGAIAGFETVPEWLAADVVLSRIREDRAAAQRIFREFVNEKIGDRTSIWDQVVGQIYLGRQEWVERMRGLVESKPRSDDHPRAQRAIGRASLNKVVESVAAVFDVSRDAIRHGRGGAPRMIAAWLARYEGESRLRSIAATLRLRSSGHISSLVAACERELARDGVLRSIVDRCLGLLRSDPADRSGEHGHGPPPWWPALPLPDVIRDGPPLPHLA